jgi:hypothetical protein
MRFALAALVLCAAPMAVAEAPGSPNAAYAAGFYLAAADAALARGGAADLSLATRALLAECVRVGRGAQQMQLIDKAMATARAALAANPQSVDARMQLAMAIGLKGRRISAVEAMRAGYAKEGRKLVEEALASAPEEAWAHALMGGWHMEVIRRAGPMARAMGASESKGVAAFERARTLAPKDAAIAMHFAVGLLGVNAKKYAAQADALFAAAEAAPPGDAFQTQMRAEAIKLRAVLKKDGPEAANRAAEVLL